MGLFDNLSSQIGSTVNRGGAAAQRATRTMRIRSELGDLERQREVAAARLGSTLYPKLSAYPELCEGCEAAMGAIMTIDERMAALHKELVAIEREAEEAKAAAKAEAQARRAATQMRAEFVCPQCGRPVEEGDAFCMNCGTRLDPSMFVRDEPPVEEASDHATCPNCGAEVTPGNKFCGSCGSPIG